MGFCNVSFELLLQAECHSNSATEHLIPSTDKAIAILDKKGKVSRGELLSEITTLKEEIVGKFEYLRFSSCKNV